MSGSTYIVEIDLETKGDLGLQKLSGGVTKLDASVSKMGSNWGSNASALIGTLDGVVERAVGIGVEFAKWGAIGGVAALTYGVVGLNSHLESTKIALGSIFQANGVASSLPGGMKLAQETIAKMRVDAQKLPGEFEDLQNIFTTVAIPGFQAGAGVDKLRDLSAKLMATGKIAQMPMDQVAREAAQLVEGRSGAHNVLGMKLMGLSGDKATAFNKLSGQARLGKLDAELDKYKDSIDEFGKSFDGISSTTVDIGKQVGTIATAPLFDRVKGLLSDINEWAGANRAEIDAWASHTGYQIAGAFEWGVTKVKEWWPAVKAFTDNAYTKLTAIWVEVEPYVERFGAALQTALKDPGTIDKLITLAKLYGAIKLGGALASGFDMLGGDGMGGKGGMLAGGAKMAGQAVGGLAKGASYTMEAASIMGWGPALAGGAEVAGAALAGLAPVAIAAAAAFALYESYSELQNMKLEASAQLQLDTYEAQMGAQYESIEALSQMNAATQDAAGSLYDFVSALETREMRSKAVADATNETVNEFYKFMGYTAAGGTAEKQTKAAADRANAIKHPGGGHGTNIQKVEIVVTTNQEPSRVARVVTDHLISLGRNPGRSPHVPNYSTR